MAATYGGMTAWRLAPRLSSANRRLAVAQVDEEDTSEVRDDDMPCLLITTACIGCAILSGVGAVATMSAVMFTREVRQIVATAPAQVLTSATRVSADAEAIATWESRQPSQHQCEAQ